MELTTASFVSHEPGSFRVWFWAVPKFIFSNGALAKNPAQFLVQLDHRLFGFIRLDRRIGDERTLALCRRHENGGINKECFSSRRFMLMREVNVPPRMFFMVSVAISSRLASGEGNVAGEQDGLNRAGPVHEIDRRFFLMFHCADVFHRNVTRFQPPNSLPGGA